jgi:hypothetical protein
MILQEIQAYLHSHSRVSLGQLADKFGIEITALREMLRPLIRKGRIRQLPSDHSSCGGCHSCDQTSLEFYEWIGQPYEKS